MAVWLRQKDLSASDDGKHSKSEVILRGRPDENFRHLVKEIICNFDTIYEFNVFTFQLFNYSP